MDPGTGILASGGSSGLERVALILAAGGIPLLAGLGMIRKGWKEGEIVRRLGNSDHVDVGDVRPGEGPYKVDGHVESGRRTLQAGGTDGPAVIDRIVVEYEKVDTDPPRDPEGPEDTDIHHDTSQGTDYEWRRIYDHVDHVPFDVADETGRVRVELPGEWDGSKDDQYELVGAAFSEDDRTVFEKGEQFPAWLRDHVKETSGMVGDDTWEIGNTPLSEDKRRRVSRRLIEPGDDVTVIGEARTVDGVTTLTGDNEVGSMYVTGEPPDELPISGDYVFSYVAGGFFALMGLLFLLLFGIPALV